MSEQQTTQCPPSRREPREDVDDLIFRTDPDWPVSER